MGLALEILVDGQARRRWETPSDEVVIGRSPQCDLTFSEGVPAESVSKRHAKIARSNGGISIEDLGSRNGTFVNGSRVTVPTRLEINDEVRLGNSGPRLTVIHTSPPSVGEASAAISPFGFLNRSAVSTVSEATPSVPAQSSSQDSNVPSAYPSQLDLPGRNSSSNTRRLVVDLQASHRKWAVVTVVFLAGAVALVLVVGASLGFGLIAQRGELVKQQKKSESDRRWAENTYASAVPSTVWFCSPIPNHPEARCTGSGFLLDSKRKWVLTNFHVVEGVSEVQVFFPRTNARGEVIVAKDEYLREQPILGRVVRTDPHLDLAIIELEEIPDGIKPLPLATSSPHPGQEVITLGNTGAVEGSLWVFSQGHVKAIEPDWSHDFPDGQRVRFQAVVIDNSIGGGDSGGPVLNSAGHVVALVQSVRTAPPIISRCISVEEIRHFFRE